MVFPYFKNFDDSFSSFEDRKLNEYIFICVYSSYLGNAFIINENTKKFVVKKWQQIFSDGSNPIHRTLLQVGKSEIVQAYLRRPVRRTTLTWKRKLYLLLNNKQQWCNVRAQQNSLLAQWDSTATPSALDGALLKQRCTNHGVLVA